MPLGKNQKIDTALLAALLTKTIAKTETPSSTLRLKSTSIPLSDDEWEEMLDLARRQGVTALLYDAILSLPQGQRPSRKVLFHFSSLAYTIEQDNIRREKALVDFSRFLETNNVPTRIIKGSALASYYLQPLHRECGDNDLYTGDQTEAVAAMVARMGIEVDRQDERDIAFVFEDTLFECHSRLLYHNDDPQWQFNNQQFNNQHFYTLIPSQSAFFLAKHTEHHAVFFHQPIRLRDLVDWSLLVTSSAFDYSKLCEQKAGTDVDVFADFMTFYCESLFGVDVQGVPPLPRGVRVADFDRMYMHPVPRHRWAIMRVARRSWHYLRYWRKYRAIYGQSMFRRFYLHNLKVAIFQRIF